jgi:Ca2+-binding RTX toxin-like protein
MFTAGPGATLGVDFREVDLNDFVAGVVDISTTLVRLGSPPTDFVELRGKFTLDAQGKVAGGTINEIETFEGGASVYDVSGISVSIATLASSWINDDTEGFLKAVFKANDTITGSSADDFMVGYAGNDTISGLAGSDTLNGDAGNDSLDGGTENDSLLGGAGNDRLNGGTGSDDMDGGAGNDTYLAESTTDAAAEAGVGTAGGTDIVLSSATAYSLGTNIENLTLIEGGGSIGGTGNALNNVITGNSGDNELNGDAGKDKLLGGIGNDTLSGGADNDTLDGGTGDDSLDGGSGDDSMAGGAGNDTYSVDSLKDKATESLANTKGGGDDTVESSVSFTLGNNLDDLVLLDSATPVNGTGNALDNAITGNKDANTLSGLAGKDALAGNGGDDSLSGGDGDDALDGGDGSDTLDGGKGTDQLTGGIGNDTYVLDLADTFSELGEDLSDTVAAMFAIDLNDAKYAEIENATLLGSAKLNATGDVGDNILTGNSGVNTLTGNDGDDTLDGGKGMDSLVGGKGNDIYFADNAKEKIVDGEGEADEVRSTVTFALAALAGIENLTLLGAAALNGTGDGGDNAVTGNDGKNKLDGGGGDDTVDGGLGNDTVTGGAGNDTLKGGQGNDMYLVDAGDTVVEAADEGTDTVQSAVNASIAAFANVENLILTGTAAIGGTGNSGNNVITGNTGDNALDGGAGADTMIGGKGNDTYTVDDAKDVVTEAGGAGTDTVLTSLGGYALPMNVENLMLTGSGNIGGSGNTLANLLTGNDGDNVLDGLTGNDTLSGGSGGVDTLNGGLGTDTYLYAAKDGVDIVNTGDKGFDRVSLVDSPYDWDTQRDGDDLLIQFVVDEAAADAEFDPTTAIRIVDQYAGAGIAFFTGDFGEEVNLFYGGDADLTTVFTASGLTGKDQGANAEVVEGTDGADTINGGGGQTDFLSGNGGDDVVNGQSGSGEQAFLYGGEGNDTLNGAAGNDNLRGDEGDDVLDGGAGRDRADYRFAKGAVAVDLSKQGVAQTIGADQGLDTLIDIENARGSAFNDTLIGNDIGNVLFGKDGDDSLVGGGGNDFMIGGKGNDTLEGAALGDFVEASYEDAKVGVVVNLTGVVQGSVAAHTATDGLGGVDTLKNIAGVFGSEFGDQFFGADNDEFFEPMGGDDTIDGGGGFDEIDYLSSSDGVTADLNKQGQLQVISASQGADLFTDIEGLDGSLFDDTLTGDKDGNFLWGRDGADSLFGANGDDRLRGGAGNDTINGGGGFDQVDYLSATGSVRVNLTLQGKMQVISAGEGSDLLFGIEDVRGSNFNDTLTGDAGVNTLTGMDGNDSLNGGGGFDFLIGGAGNDILNGGSLADGNAVSYIDAPDGIIANLSSTTKFGVAANSVSDGFGSVDRVSNVNGVIGSAFNDTMIGGNLNDFFEGMGGNDSIDGGGGFNILEYFDSIDGVTVDLSKQGQAQQISASQGKDTFVNIIDVYGSSFDDTLIGSGIDNILFGRGGDDRLVVSNSAFLAADGADGTDRLVVSGSFVTITQQDVLRKLFSIEEIDLTGTGNNSVTLNALDVLQTSETGVMRIIGNAGDTVSSQGQLWQFKGQESIDGQTHNVYTTNSQGTQVTLQIEADVTQFIS